MFRDAQEELKRLEEQLLAEEPEEKEEALPREAEPEETLTEDDLDQIRMLLNPEPACEVRNFANQYGAEADAEEEDEPDETAKDAGRLRSVGVIALTALVLLGVVVTVTWWFSSAGGLG